MSQSSRAVSRNEKNLGILSKQYSSRDLPSHTKLKYRQTGQNNRDDLKHRDFRSELREKELKVERQNQEAKGALSSTSATLAIASSSSSSSSGLHPTKKVKHEGLLPLDIDADDPIVIKNDERLSRFEREDDEDDDDDDDEDDNNIYQNRRDNEVNGNRGAEKEADEDDSDEDSEDDSDEDDTAELLAELNRIKQERVIEEAKREAEQKARDEQIRMESILKGNPLTAGKSDFKVKRRWDDDVVFRNCSRDDVTEKEKPFINDTLRSEFHKKFMEKYIQ